MIRRPKFKDTLNQSGIDPERVIAEIWHLAEIVDAPPLSVSVSRDGDDDAVLAVAVAARADLIVSGDLDPLVLGSYAGIPIATPTEAIALHACKT